MLPPPQAPPYSSTSLPHLIRTTLSYDTNVMLAAIISLLLVILFVLLLHLYARWFLLQARRRSRTSVTVPHVLGSRFHRRLTIIDTTAAADNSPPKCGLPFSLVASLPLFIYKSSYDDEYSKFGVLECAICLSVFEEDEIGRKLPGCGHPFHVECIDMWLNSHSTCPICRASIQRKTTDFAEIDVVDQEPIRRLSTDVPINGGDSISENRENESYVVEIDLGLGFSSSSALGGSLKNFLSSSTSRSGGKIHPSNLNAGEPEE